MKDNVRRCKETFLRSQAFGRENIVVEPTSFIGRQVNELNLVLTGLDVYTAAQAAGVSAARQGTKAKDAAHAKLMRDLDAICRTARPIAANDPNLLQQFRAPHHQSVQDVLAAADAIAGAARQHRAEFLQRGMSESFIEELEADIETLREVVTRTIENRRAHVTATAVLDGLVERGMRALRELDTYVRNTYATEPAKLTAWRSASRVERRSTRARNAAPPNTPPTSPTPNTPAPTPAV